VTRPALTKPQIALSPYLSEISTQHGESHDLETLYAAVETADAGSLLSLKAIFALAFSCTEFESFDDAGEIWSRFADATIQRALSLAWEQASARHRLKLPTGPAPGLFILGLGKLGGQDLNFSSDVDLIAVFDPETLPVPETKGQAYIASDICKRVTQILQPRNAPDFVWRADWRLRPESSGTGLAISTTKAETFYFFRSLPWHRLALMKARVVGGDIAAGEQFLSRLEPFIWRRNLDFTTLDELAALKTRINNEHPGLQYERAAPEPITPQASGFNVKLGRGGIREIEFIANAQQLIHGGKHPRLRIINTRAALSELADAGFLTAFEAGELRDHYAVFRQLENTLQMLRNEHSHIVPNGDDLDACLGLLGNPDDFDKDIYTRRQLVHKKFSELFQDRPTPDDTLNLGSLSGLDKKIAESWCHGFQDHGLPINKQTKYRDLGQKLTKRVMRLDSSEAFKRIDGFLTQIGRSEQYFALLNRQPALLDKLIVPLLHSPHMSEILKQSPHIIDIFLSSDSSDLIEQSQFVLTSKDYEHRLEALRRFVNEQLFNAYTKFLEGVFSPKGLQTKLTAIAERTLELSIQIVCEDLGLTGIALTVLGLGKMGTQAMAPQSDLDLIFIFPDDVDSDLSAKIVQRLRTTLTVKLREGIAYELDMRLRPSGRSGPPAVKLSSFYDHHMMRAHSWEHIALAPARIVAGDPSLGDEVMRIKSDIFARPRDIRAFKQDAFAMLTRLRSERLIETDTDVWRCKLRRGGLMGADYLRSCLAVTRTPITLEFESALAVWNGLQSWERLLGLTGKPIAATPLRFADSLGLKTLKNRQSKLEKTVKAATYNFFKDVDVENIPAAAPIVWTN
jgi:glutamate-ammonia-ligase adenylyltransferase